jgi:tetratricopeptide (TPR) repeat protein
MNLYGKLLFLLALAAARLERPEIELHKDLERANAALEHWDVARAGAIAERLATAHLDSVEARLTLARAHFLAGRYDDTLAMLDEVTRLAPAPSPFARQASDFRDFVAPLARLGRSFAVEESDHFRFHFVDGPDRVLAGRGLQALEACRLALEEDLGFAPGDKVRVEIFPDAESFEKASTLTRDEIETSGTIALCKFNRLMVLSPRLVLRGFPWTDTLCHEYTHYVLWRLNGPTVPIWLHEGIAKHQEPRWRQAGGAELTPMMQAVLRDGLERGDLVELEAMHPSFAKLKTPRQVAMASAEVLSLIRAILDRGGAAALTRILQSLADGRDWRQALEVGLDQPFAAFWQEWRESTALALAAAAGPAPPAKLVELSDRGGGAPADDASAATSRAARLGELLAGAGHHRAAAVEYERACEGPQESPIALNRLGRLHRLGGDLDLALGAFVRAEQADPEYAPTLTNLGLVQRDRGEAAAAAAYLERAVRVNPFDPQLHRVLAELYAALGKAGERRRAEADLAVLEAGGGGR